MVIAEKAAERAAAEGLSVGVLDLRSLVPLDVDALREAVAHTGRALVVHEAPSAPGSARSSSRPSRRRPSGRCGRRSAAWPAPDAPYPPGSVEDLYLPSVDRVLAGIRTALEA